MDHFAEVTSFHRLMMLLSGLWLAYVAVVLVMGLRDHLRLRAAIAARAATVVICVLLAASCASRSKPAQSAGGSTTPTPSRPAGAQPVNQPPKGQDCSEGRIWSADEARCIVPQ